jgi:hypothetical protein
MQGSGGLPGKPAASSVGVRQPGSKITNYFQRSGPPPAKQPASTSGRAEPKWALISSVTLNLAYTCFTCKVPLSWVTAITALLTV